MTPTKVPYVVNMLSSDSPEKTKVARSLFLESPGKLLEEESETKVLRQRVEALEEKVEQPPILQRQISHEVYLPNPPLNFPERRKGIIMWLREHQIKLIGGE